MTLHSVEVNGNQDIFQNIFLCPTEESHIGLERFEGE